MDVLALLALVLALVVAVWSVIDRLLPLGLLALAVILLALEPVLTISTH